MKNLDYASIFLDKRTWLKTLSWRILAIVITIFFLTLFGVSFEKATIAGIVINLIKTVFFYLHERLWDIKT